MVAGQAGRSVTFVDEDDRKLVKEIVKQNQGKVQERVVPPASLKKWANQVEQMAGDIERLILVCRCSHLAICPPAHSVAMQSYLHSATSAFLRPEPRSGLSL